MPTEPTKKNREPIARKTLKLLAAAETIHQSRDQEVVYLGRELLHCSLPYRDPGDVEHWVRSYGEKHLVITPGFIARQNARVGVPFGSIPRLVVYWITTEAVRNHSKMIPIDDSYSRFLERLDLGTSGGPRGDWSRLRDQMIRLFKAHIEIQDDSPALTGLQGDASKKVDVAEEHRLWWDPKSSEQLPAFPNFVHLTDYFYKLITEAPVPADMRVLRALKASPLRLDLYFLFTHAAFLASKAGREQTFSWDTLYLQFGQEFARPRKLKEAILAHLKFMQPVYPDLRLELRDRGIAVLPTSKPAIPVIDQKP